MGYFKPFMISILIVLMLASCVTAVDEIYFSDPKLTQIITEAYDLEELKLITELDLRNQGIESISGLENLKQLQSLNLRGNPVTDITAVSELSELEYLNLRETAVADLTPLASLRELTYLNIHSTPVITLDVIGALTSLETLIMRNVFIGSDGAFLKNLINLQRLNIRATGIADLAIIDYLMERGALQDQDDLDIRDNPLLLANENNVNDIMQSPTFSHAPGFYQDDFLLSISTTDPEVTVHYTLDGADPTASSLVYNDPILISENFTKEEILSDVNFLGSFNPRRVARDRLGQLMYQGYEPWVAVDNFQAVVVRAAAFKEGKIFGEVITSTYFIDSAGSQLYSLPVISIVTDPFNLIDHDKGIFVAGAHASMDRPDRPWHNQGNYTQRGREWERPAHIEFFELGGQLGFQQNIGVRIHGGVTRSFPQKSLRLYARASYDTQSTFDYPVFPNLTDYNGQPIAEFNRLLLRNSGNDWPLTLIADAMMQNLISHTKVDTQAYRPAVVFINGEYWGLANLRERFDSYYFRSTYDLDPDDLVILEGTRANITEGNSGDDHHYRMMLLFALRNDLSLGDNYQYMATQMDIDNYIDYNVAQIYYGNTDWPGNNIEFWRARTDEYQPDAPYGHDGRWRWLLYDTDHGFGYAQGRNAYRHNTLHHALVEGDHLLRSLLENENFTNQFINTFADHLNTSFESNRVINVINDLEAVLLPEIDRHINRWGTFGGTVEQWLDNLAGFKEFAEKRPDGLRQILIQQFNLTGLYELQVENPTLGGTVTINSLTIDHDTVGIDNPASFTGIYFSGVPVQIEAKASDGYQFVGWEGSVESNEVTLTITANQNQFLRAVFTPLRELQ